MEPIPSVIRESNAMAPTQAQQLASLVEATSNLTESIGSGFTEVNNVLSTLLTLHAEGSGANPGTSGSSGATGYIHKCMQVQSYVAKLTDKLREMPHVEVEPNRIVQFIQNVHIASGFVHMDFGSQLTFAFFVSSSRPASLILADLKYQHPQVASVVKIMTENDLDGIHELTDEQADKIPACVLQLIDRIDRCVVGAMEHLGGPALTWIVQNIVPAYVDNHGCLRPDGDVLRPTDFSYAPVIPDEGKAGLYSMAPGLRHLINPATAPAQIKDAVARVRSNFPESARSACRTQLVINIALAMYSAGDLGTSIRLIEQQIHNVFHDPEVGGSYAKVGIGMLSQLTTLSILNPTPDPTTMKENLMRFENSLMHMSCAPDGHPSSAFSTALMQKVTPSQDVPGSVYNPVNMITELECARASMKLAGANKNMYSNDICEHSKRCAEAAINLEHTSVTAHRVHTSPKKAQRSTSGPVFDSSRSYQSQTVADSARQHAIQASAAKRHHQQMAELDDPRAAEDRGRDGDDQDDKRSRHNSPRYIPKRNNTWNNSKGGGGPGKGGGSNKGVHGFQRGHQSPKGGQQGHHRSQGGGKSANNGGNNKNGRRVNKKGNNGGSDNAAGGGSTTSPGCYRCSVTSRSDESLALTTTLPAPLIDLPQAQDDLEDALAQYSCSVSRCCVTSLLSVDSISAFVQACGHDFRVSDVSARLGLTLSTVDSSRAVARDYIFRLASAGVPIDNILHSVICRHAKLAYENSGIAVGDSFVYAFPATQAQDAAVFGPSSLQPKPALVESGLKGGRDNEAEYDNALETPSTRTCAVTIAEVRNGKGESLGSITIPVCSVEEAKDMESAALLKAVREQLGDYAANNRETVKILIDGGSGASIVKSIKGLENVKKYTRENSPIRLTYANGSTGYATATGIRTYTFLGRDGKIHQYKAPVLVVPDIEVEILSSHAAAHMGLETATTMRNGEVVGVCRHITDDYELRTQYESGVSYLTSLAPHTSSV